MTSAPLWARIALSPRAQAIYDTLEPSQRERFWRIISVIKHAPEDGAFYMRNTDGTVTRQITGANMHVIYTVRYWSIGRVLLIALIEISDWQPWYVE